jgi:hypothetical protein
MQENFVAMPYAQNASSGFALLSMLSGKIQAGLKTFWLDITTGGATAVGAEPPGASEFYEQ